MLHRETLQYGGGRVRTTSEILANCYTKAHVFLFHLFEAKSKALFSTKSDWWLQQYQISHCFLIWLASFCIFLLSILSSFSFINMLISFLSKWKSTSPYTRQHSWLTFANEVYTLTWQNFNLFILSRLYFHICFVSLNTILSSLRAEVL